MGIQGLTPEIARTLGVDRTDGALVTGVSKDGPAQRAGIQPADVIVEFDGQQVKDANDLPLMLARAPVKKTVKLKPLREKLEVALNLTIAELKESPPTARREELG